MCAFVTMVAVGEVHAELIVGARVGGGSKKELFVDARGEARVFRGLHVGGGLGLNGVQTGGACGGGEYCSGFHEYLVVNSHAVLRGPKEPVVQPWIAVESELHVLVRPYDGRLLIPGNPPPVDGLFLALVGVGFGSSVRFGLFAGGGFYIHRGGVSRIGLELSFEL